MSAAMYTPGPLSIGLPNMHNTDVGRCFRTEIADSRGILIAHSYGLTKAESLDRARRFMACVNACAGIPTEELEQAGKDALYIAVAIKEIIEARNELATALRNARRMKS